MRPFALVALIGCGFKAVPATGDDAPATSDATDAPFGSEPSPEALPVSPCNAADLDLVACFPFEGDTDDHSGYMHSVSASIAGYAPGHDGGQAAVIASGDSFVVTNPIAAFDISMMTILMWIKPTSLPAAGLRMGLLDSGNRYRMFLEPGGALRCALTSGPDLTSATGYIGAGAWHRVACTFDGSALRIYVDSAEIANLLQSGTINTSSSGIVVGQNNPSGENFDGAIDDFELWGSLKTP